jgi:hypothetical protein
VPLVDAAYEGLGQDAPLVREQSIGQRRPTTASSRVAGQPKSLVIGRQFLAQKNKSPRLAEGSQISESGVQPNAESPGSDAVQSGKAA